MVYLIKTTVTGLLLSTVFAVSESFPDVMNVPKWYCGVALLLVVGFLYVISSLFMSGKDAKANYLQFTENAACAVCGLQSLLFLLQTTGTVPKYGEFSAGRFDNVAGLASCLCLSLPLGWQSAKAGNALGMEKECNVLLADYDLSLLMGDTYRALGQRDSTLHYYGRVHEMCPSRLIPQYEMFRVYREANDTVRCFQLRKEILRKPIKVKSRETDDMLDEVREYFP